MSEYHYDKKAQAIVLSVDPGICGFSCMARCHSSCPIPAAVLKAAEVAMSMALPRDVSIEFRK